MRIERIGGLPPLTPRVEEFLRKKLAGVAADDLVHPEKQRADFLCLGNSLIVELKTLEQDASERIHHVVDDLRQRPDWPTFFGAVPFEAYLEHLGEDAEAIRRKVLDRVGRAIVRHLHKANNQLASEAARAEGDPTRLLILINEDHVDYDPQIVAYVIMHELRKLVANTSAQVSIDGVIYLSERHASVEGQQLVLPIVAILGPGGKRSLTKTAVLDNVMDAWAEWNGCPILPDVGPVPTFDAIEVISERAPRSEWWRTNYRRSPYMRSLTVEELTQRFDEITVTNLLWGLKSSPRRLSPEEIAVALERFTHVIEELNWRHIPMQKMRQSLERLQEAARRLGMGDDVVQWLAGVSPDRP